MEKLTGLKFGAALDIVAGTERWVKYAGGIGVPKQWKPTVIVTREGYTCGALLDEQRKVWFPAIEQQKELAWEVEPEKVEEIFITVEKSATSLNENAVELWFNRGLNKMHITTSANIPWPVKTKLRLVPVEPDDTPQEGEI